MIIKTTLIEAVTPYFSALIHDGHKKVFAKLSLEAKKEIRKKTKIVPELNLLLGKDYKIEVVPRVIVEPKEEKK